MYHLFLFYWKIEIAPSVYHMGTDIESIIESQTQTAVSYAASLAPSFVKQLTDTCMNLFF